MRFWRSPGFAAASEFFGYPKDTSDCRCREGTQTRKAAERVIDYALARPGVWFARRIEIAGAWTAAFGRAAA